MKVFFDGGWRPGRGMALAVVIGGRVVAERDLGPGTSMDAEWLALLHARRLARDLALAAPVLLGDALAVIAQATGAARCPPRFRHHLYALLAGMAEIEEGVAALTRTLAERRLLTM